MAHGNDRSLGWTVAGASATSIEMFTDHIQIGISYRPSLDSVIPVKQTGRGKYLRLNTKKGFVCDTNL